MSGIALVVEHDIKPGRLDEFTRMVYKLIARTAHEPGVLRYDYHVSGDGKRGVNIEVFRDADAVMEHARNVADLLPDIVDVAPIARIDVIGEASHELKAELATATSDYFSRLGGIER